MKIHFAPILILFLLFSSCQDSEVNPNSHKSLDEMLDCHSSTAWTLSDIEESLIGEWAWEYISCYWTPEEANGENYLGLSATFKTDRTLDIIQNGQISQTSTWEIIEVNGSHQILVSPESNQVYGKVLICGDEIIFYSSYIDGCDNYFEKVN